MNDRTPATNPTPVETPAAPQPTRDERVMEMARQIAADMGKENWSLDGDGEATSGAPATPSPSTPAPKEQTPTEQTPPASPQQGERKLSIDPDTLADDEIEQLAQNPKLSNRAIRAKVDEAVRLITAGRAAEVDPSIRQLALELFQGDKELAKPIEEKGYQRGREESEADAKALQQYNQILNIKRLVREGDEQAEALWDQYGDQYDEWLVDYRRWQRSKNEPKQPDAEALRKEAEQKVRSETENQVIVAQIQGWLQSLDVYSKLPVAEQDAIYKEWMNASKGDLKELFKAGNAWELERQYQRYGGEKTAKTAAELVQEKLTQDRLRSLPSPETSSGTEGDEIRSWEDAAKAYNAGKITDAEYNRYKRQYRNT